jgi:NAD(P)-dependent dehydrogenase (short-subunit alcohol dehydrogenase family)
LPLQRYVLRQRDAQPASRRAVDVAGQRFVITDDGLGIAERLAAALRAQGATAEIVDFDTLAAASSRPERIDGLVHLWSLNPASQVGDVKRFFAITRDALLAGLDHLLVAGAGYSPSRGGGFAGMVKSLSKEFPALRAHWLHLDPSEPAITLAGYVEHELLADEGLIEVGYTAGRRLTRDLVPVDLDDRALDDLPLDAGSVVLLTGGARGITAGLAVALARRYRCHLELVGRSELPASAESAATRGIADPKQLRHALISANPTLRPANIEAQLRRILAEREIVETLKQIRQAGGSVHYTQLDVRDDARFAGFIEDVYERRGRIDGVIHGAGVVEDKLVRDKTPDSFSRVFDTKVNAALVLRKSIRDDVKFVVFFSSVASAFGNRGQVDYASANDVLDKLARSWGARIAGRVLSINWGPWADTGMVSESLGNDYRRRGIGLIPKRDGIDALLRELSAPAQESQVVLMCGTPESFGMQTSAAAVDWAA